MARSVLLLLLLDRKACTHLPVFKRSGASASVIPCLQMLQSAWCKHSYT